ncbi:hypothetical protein IE53DRAFT_362301 [Violaceomyces palustris]|uniref:Uncharacterized protein n=1 Tax=Violaceomyces palustris TaxID=1673888 RepID=A0ACD0NXF8_9BASI|nr:hypothetical protein IE53DRAFT_362301 [Violaceomyces palustris]
MSSTSKLRIGYVPEHFAAPLLQLARSEWGTQNLEIVSQPSGTGQMLTSLDASQPSGQKIDVAVALTEALIAGIAKGRKDYKLVGSYVRSSLNWAVITGTDPKASGYNSISDLQGTKIGISRIGSGSQIMASVMALQNGWTDAEGKVKDIEFKVNDTFENLRKGVNQVAGLETSCFMWEWFTTKPYVDSKEVRFIGSVPTPWPSWTIASSVATTLSDPAQTKRLDEFLIKLDESITSFANPTSRADGTAAAFIKSEHPDYKPEDVEQWLKTVRWAGEQTPTEAGAALPTGQNTGTTSVSEETLRSTLATLEKAGVVSTPTGGWESEAFVFSQGVKGQSRLVA